MKKQIIGAVSTLCVAVALIGGNGLISAHAMDRETVPNVKITGQYKQPANVGSDLSISNVVISKQEDAPDMAKLRTSQDMNKEKAVAIAKKALEDKFNISLDGTYALPIFSKMVNREGTYYFVSFAPLADVKAPRTPGVGDAAQVKGGSGSKGQSYDIYIAFVESKTGEVVSADKNPQAPKGSVGG